MRKNHIPKQRILIEVDLTMHDQLKVIAKHYGASVRGTVVRYIRDGLVEDAHLLTHGEGHSS